jgi:hypothetical protein
MKIAAIITLGMSALLVTSPALAQNQKPDNSADRITDLQIDLMRKDIRDQKKQIIAANLPLTGDEAAKFWPMYTDYTQETIKVNDQRYALVKEYATNYNSMTDTNAASYIRRWLEADQAATKLRLDWVPKFEQVLGEKKAAMFFQLDRRLGLIQELQISSQLPLIQQ